APEDFLGQTPADFFAHDLVQGRHKWREMLDQGHLKSDTYEQRFDGSSMIIEGDYTCLYDDQGRILGHFGIQRDVTQQRTLEEALAEQKKQLEQIMQATPNGIYIYDLQTFCNGYANEKISEILGYTYAEIVAQGRSVLSHNIHPDDWPRVEAHLQRCLSLEDRQVVEIEYRFRHGDGHWCWLLSRDVVFSRTAKGSVREILGIFQDITERKQLEQQLNENLARFQQLTQNVPALVYRYETDATGRKSFTYLSQRAEDLLGVSVEACLADANLFWGAIDPEDVEQMTASCAQAQAEGLPWHWQFRLTTPAGVQKWLEGNAIFSKRPGGGVISDGVMLDITERKTTEQQLRDSKMRWQFALEGAGHGVWDWNVQTGQVYFSPSWKIMLGYAFDEIADNITAVCEKIRHPDDRDTSLAALEAYFAGETPIYQSVQRLLAKDGTYRWILDRGKVLTWTEDDQPLRMIGTHTDITAQKQLEASLQQQIQREQAQNRITQAIRETLDLETILSTATREVTKLFPLYQVGVVRYCQDFWQVQFDYCVSPDRPSAKGYQIPDRDNPIAVRVKNQELVHISDDNPVNDVINQSVRADFPGTWLVIPLVVEGKVWGTYNLIVDDPRYRWQPEDIALVQAIANQLAIAIQQVELYEQLEHLNTDLEIEVEQRTAELETALSLADCKRRLPSKFVTALMKN
ncbi:MAG: PAS domain-containing protein, partial [Synechococcaceae cyanobacterium SM2_3_60]|nr:PAS domain-containing protein [Synechococcaceae cyanobacterium SM2_3_60]